MPKKVNKEQEELLKELKKIADIQKENYRKEKLRCQTAKEGWHKALNDYNRAKLR